MSYDGNKADWFPKQEIEIERKWLLKELPKVEFDQVIQIEQYYKDWLRYRRQHDGIGEFFFCIKKERLGHGVNRETWQDCTKEDYFFNYPQGEKPIKKTRYVLEYKGHNLEIDTFEDGLVMMEIEVKSLSEPIQIPQIIHAQIEKEVTGDPDYSNYQLYRKANQLEPVKSKMPTKQVIRQLKRDYFVHRNKNK
jgi:CYTH domain-containing protein